MSIFTGAGVALVTPMHADGSVNFDKMKELIEFQIANDTDALIICGTTGEASTMSDEVQIECIRFAKEAAAGRVPVIAGAGSNDTAHCIALAQGCEKAGADAVLLVTPYYNKATQKGLILHYTAVANSINIPIILYNVPGRTGCNIAPKTVAELAKVKNIVAVRKQAAICLRWLKLRLWLAPISIFTAAMMTRFCLFCLWAARALSPFCPT